MAAVRSGAPADPTPPQLDGLSTRQLLSLWAASLRELHRRGVVRTFNNPIGDIAEDLVCRHYGGERAGFSQKAWDVQVGDDRLQVKSLRQTGTRARRNLSPIRSEDYTAVIVVVFDETCALSRPCAFPAPWLTSCSPTAATSTGGSSTSVAAYASTPT